MASYTIAANERAKHATLVASTVDTVTFTSDVGDIEVVKRSATDEIYYTIDGTTPTVGGANTLVLPAAMCTARHAAPGATAPVVKLISSGTPTYTVQSA